MSIFTKIKLCNQTRLKITNAVYFALDLNSVAHYKWHEKCLKDDFENKIFPMQRKRSNKLFAVQIFKGTGANLKSWDYQGNKDRYIMKNISLW